MEPVEDQSGSTEPNMRTPQLSKPPGVQEELGSTKVNRNGGGANATAANGTSANGTSANGTSTNGTSANGTSTNGTGTNGSSANGSQTNVKSGHKAKVFLVIFCCFL